MTTVLDLPPLKKREFEFSHNGERVVWDYSPLTAEQVDAVRASVPAPKPPAKRIEGAAPELVMLKRRGVPIDYPDYDDPAYQEALRRHENDLALEMVRVALGWEMAREEFASAMRSRLTDGVLAQLMGAVNSATYAVLDSGKVDEGKGGSNPSTGAEGASSTPTAT